MKRLIPLLTAVFVASGSCLATEPAENEADLAKAREYLKRADDFSRHHDKAAALEVIKQAAELGLPAAEFELGKLSYLGADVPKDLDLAELMLRRANRYFVPVYARNLACLLYERGTFFSMWEAVQLMKQAAQQSDILAMVLYSRFLRFGVAGTVDPARADVWLNRAFRQLYPALIWQTPEKENLRERLPPFLESSDCGPSDKEATAAAWGYQMDRYEPPPVQSRIPEKLRGPS